MKRGIILRLAGSVILVPAVVLQSLWMLAVILISPLIMWVYWVYTGNSDEPYKWLEKCVDIWWKPFSDTFLSHKDIKKNNDMNGRV